MLSLASLNVGEKGIVKGFLSDEIEEHFTVLGLIKGTYINVLYSSPFDNPKAYYIRGTVFALRSEDTQKIFVEKLTAYP